MKSVIHVSISSSSGGGISQLIRIYQQRFSNLCHVASCSDSNFKCVKLIYFILALVKLTFYILFARKKVVHFHGASYTSYRRKLMLSRWCKLLGCKTIYHLHGGDFDGFHKNVGTKYLKYTLNEYNCIVVLSEYWKNYIRDHFGCKRIFVVNNIVNEPQNLVSPSPFDDQFFNVLYMGALYKDKGVFDLVRMVEQNINLFRKNIRIHVCGGRTDKEISEFKSVVSGSVVGDIVVYHGWVDGQEKLRYLRYCDVLILPSYYEGLPMCVLEAMSYCKPVLATPVGSVPEVLLDGNTGYLFQPGDLRAMCSSIIKLQLSRDTCKEMGANAGRFVMRYYPQNVEKQLYNVYKSL